MIEALAAQQRPPDDEETGRIRSAAAAAGFDPTALVRVRGGLVGLRYRGRSLATSDRLPNETWHYLKHVVLNREWPDETSQPNYVESLRHSIETAGTPILLDVVHGRTRLTFFAPSGILRGPGGGDWIAVGVDVHYGYWTTGYQIDVDPRAHASRSLSMGVQQWLRT